MIDFLSAIGLIFIIEGLLLFVSPKRLKKILQIITVFPENKIRSIGSMSILAGIVLLWIIRKWIINVNGYTYESTVKYIFYNFIITA